ncbi:MAG: hypothetical protein IT364_03575, partial [Candidatus Hydrogenedentes bacterium]|nr:hypothetical protein [Candidatus Hydrogenedentota bacterium]
MSTIAIAPESALMPKRHYANVRHSVASWLLTTDHKRIAILYLVSITLF